jgi:hypothetical protein
MIFLSFFFFLGYKKQDKMPKGKLTSSQRKSRATKAAITRCKNKCEQSEGKKPKRKMSSSQRQAARDRYHGNEKLKAWQKFLAQYRLDHPKVKDVMKKAGEAWRNSAERDQLYSQ